MCEKTKKDLVEQIELGQKLFSSFVQDESNLVTKDKSLGFNEEA